MFVGIGQASAAIYYIDPTAGNDANDGLSVGGAKSTISAAATIASAGSTITLLPGTHAIASKITLTKQLIFQGSGDVSTIIVTPPIADDAIGLNAGSSGTEFHAFTFTGGAEVSKSFINVAGANLTGIVLSDITFMDCSHRPIAIANSAAVTVNRTTTIRCKQEWVLTLSNFTANNSVWLDDGNSVSGSPMIKIVAGTATFNNCLFLGGYDNVADAMIVGYTATTVMNNSIIVGTNFVYDETGVWPPLKITTGTITLNNCVMNGNAYKPNDTIAISGVTQNNTLNNVNPKLNSILANDAIFTFEANDSAWVYGTPPLSALVDILEPLGAHITWFPDDNDTFSTEAKDVIRAFHTAGHDLGVGGFSSSMIDKNNPFYVTYVGVGTNPRVTITVNSADDATLVARTDQQVDVSLDISKHSVNHWIGGPVGLPVDSIMDVINDHPDWTVAVNWGQDHDDTYAYTLASGTYSVSGNTDILFDMDRLWNEEITLSKSSIEDIIGNGFTATSYFAAVNGESSDAAVAARIKAEGFTVALTNRGNPVQLSSIANIYDIGNKYTSFTAKNLRGTGYSDLTDAQKESRIRAAARSWSVTARMFGLWLTHGSASPDLSTDVLTPTEIGWLIDELVKNDVRVLDFKEARDYIAATSIVNDDGFTRVLSTVSNLTLDFTSPAIDSGTSVGLSTDYAGNSIYGNPDIGAYEYQPPYTFALNDIPTTGSTRLYSDGKYRMTTASSTAALATFSVAPVGGFYTASTSQYMDLTITTWDTTGDKNKQWTATSAEGAFQTHATSTVYTIGDLIPNSSYQFKLDNTASTTAVTNNTQCTNGVCIADANGSVTFTYTGGYSTHTFALTRITSGSAQKGTITVTTLVINDNGGTKTTADFPLFVNSTPVTSGIATSFLAPANAYTITATADSNYTQTFSGDCDSDGRISLSPGDFKTCTVTMNDSAPVSASSGSSSASTASAPATSTPTSSPQTTTSSGLTSTQISSILSILSSFGADADTIAKVQAALFGQSTSALTPSTDSGQTGFARNLKLSSTGPDVQALQQFLNAHGFTVSTQGPGSTGNETNLFGLLTQSALIKFQKANGIVPAAGYFGPITRGKISES